MSEDKAVAWLREQVTARKAEAEGLACVSASVWAVCQNSDFDYTVYADAGATAHYPLADVWRHDAAVFVAANDPQDVIARCEAELAVLDLHRNERMGGRTKRRNDVGCVVCDLDDGIQWQSGYCKTVRALASGYRHREGYAQHWGSA